MPLGLPSSGPDTLRCLDVVIDGQRARRGLSQTLSRVASVVVPRAARQWLRPRTKRDCTGNRSTQASSVAVVQVTEG